MRSNFCSIPAVKFTLLSVLFPAASASASLTLHWDDNSFDENGFAIERSDTGGAPLILPALQTVNAGGTVNLYAAASGATAYQWQYNGANVPGATGSSLTLANIATYYGGVFTVAVTGTSTVSAGLTYATFQLMSRAYAFALPANSADAAMVATLPPGTYTARVSGAGASSGIAQIEVYELR